MNKVRLEYLHLRKFRKLEPCRLQFSERENFIVGPNGSGKTTLLKLLSMAVRGSFVGLRKETEPVDLEYRWTQVYEQVHDGSVISGGGAYSCTLRIKVTPPREAASPRRSAIPQLGGSVENVRVDASPEWEISGEVVSVFDPKQVLSDISGEADSGRMKTTFRLTSSGIAETDPPLGTGFRMGRTMRDLSLFEPRFFLSLAVVMIDGMTEADIAPPITGYHRKRALLLSRIFTDELVGRFDEALGAFEGIVGATKPSDEVSVSWMGAARGGVSAAVVPFDIVTQYVSDPAKFEVSSSESKTIENIREILGATEVRARPRLRERKPDDEVEYQGFDLWFSWPNGLEQHHSALSFGQKRIVSLLWHLGCIGDAPFIADEMANGLHANWVYQCRDLIRPRQSFHAVQNPLLVDLVGPAEDDAVQRQFVICSGGFTAPSGTWVWRNPTEEEAQHLREAWGVGIQSLSEIMQDMGLW